jgi:hypothetical protein
MILFVFVVVVAVVGGHALAKAELQSERNCRGVASSATTHNKLIDTLLANSIASQQLTDAEKVKRLQQYGEALHETVPRCPKLSLW